MPYSKSAFMSFLENESQKYDASTFPVRTPAMRRFLKVYLDCDQLHPNPEDEFCDPGIGPNDQIITQYMLDFRQKADLGKRNDYCTRPLQVVRMHPEGYMILNGHHRWAAAVRLGFKKIRVKIVNLTSIEDVKKLLSRSKNDRRVTIDLDEVLLRTEFGAEKPLSFPLRLIHPAPLRLGVPALFHFLRKNGYDVWVYTDQSHSFEHVRHYFLYNNAPITGVVSRARRMPHGIREAQNKIDDLLKQKYRTTLHIDNDSIIVTSADSREFAEYPLAGGAEWAREAMDTVRSLPHE